MTDQSTIKPPPEGVLEALKATWGYDELRPLQGEAIEAGIEGRDALIVLPTGGGKSLCYQLPPLVTNKTTLVISPLIALMKDQLDGLSLQGVPACAIHSQLDPDEARAAFDGIRAGDMRIVLTSPERALTPGFLTAMNAIPDGLGAMAVDEAHCVSHWGHDFRPEFRRLHELREALGFPPCQAFTATATPRVQEDIVQQLGLRDPLIRVGHVDRPNLIYRIRRRERATAQVADAIKKSQADEPGSAAIVYTLSRKDAEEMATGLKSQGIDAKHYHAGLSANERRRTQDAFTRERLDVVVATVAFGMGIDRSNVRLVVHATMPKSVEAYQQEAGRAGRDGLPAECLMLFSSSDVSRWSRLLSDGEGEQARTEQAMLTEIRRFCAGHTCRHKALTEHFGQLYDVPEGGCGACDVCLGEVETMPDAHVLAQKVLSAIARTEQRFGAGYIADVLRGDSNERVIGQGHDGLSVFGLLRHMKKREIVAVIDQLVDQGVAQRSTGDYPTIGLNERSIAVLKGDDTDVVITAAATDTARPRVRSAARDIRPLEGPEKELFEAMRALRKEIAEENGVPPYVVFSDATLRELAKARPSARGPMLGVKGVGPAKLEAFGDRFLDLIAQHTEI